MNSKERFLHVEKRVHMLIKFAIAWYIMLWLSTMWVSFNYLFYSSPIWLLTMCPLFLKFLLFNEIYSYGSLGLLLHLQHGYAVIDLQILGPLKIEDICMMKFLSSVLQVLLILHMNVLFTLYLYVHTRPVIIMFKLLLFQFVSQRQRQIRGSALKLLMDYIRTFPCKVNLLIWDCVGPNNIIQFNHFHFLKLLPMTMLCQCCIVRKRLSQTMMILLLFFLVNTLAF
jgi:hypothetical protein